MHERGRGEVVPARHLAIEVQRALCATSPQHVTNHVTTGSLMQLSVCQAGLCCTGGRNPTQLRELYSYGCRRLTSKCRLRSDRHSISVVLPAPGGWGERAISRSGGDTDQAMQSRHTDE